MKLNKKVISLFLALLLMFSQTAYAAKSVSDLKAEIEKNQKEIEKIKEEIKGKEKDKDQATAKMNELDMEIEGIQVDIDNVQAVIDEKQAEIDNANVQIDSLNAEIEKTTEKLKTRMKVMYEMGNISYLEIILESKGFSDLFTRIAAVQAIAKHDNAIIDDYTNQVTQVTEYKTLIENEQAEQLEAKGILDEKQGKLEALRNEKSALVKSLEKDIAALEAAEKQMEKDEQTLQAELNKALGKTPTVVYQGNGKFLWPSAVSTRVSSPFGYRIHPIFGTRRLHRGMDISAPQGSDVLAGEAGVVVTAGYNNSYGYYITINHGGGYVTLYAHNSKLLVSKGDTVSRGQVIAKCGSTGNSTGPHIHFEVQINGKLVNPANYL